MPKMRVYELARELGIESKVLVSKIQKAGILISGHQSALDDSQVEKVKELVKTKSTPTPTTAKPRTIIRRRRKAGSQPDADESDSAVAADSADSSGSDAVEAQSEEAPKKIVRKKAVADPAEVEASPAEAAEVPKKAETEAPAVASQEEDAPAEVASVSDAEVAKDSADVSAETKSAEPTEPEEPAAATADVAEVQGTEDSVAKKAEPAETPRRRVSAGASATIVRRATKEEVEDLESRVDRRSAGRKEDHRGTRVTGMGLLGNRVGDENESPSHQRGGPGRSDRASSSDGTTKEDDDQASRKTTPKVRRAHAGLTTRALLTQAEALISETGEEAARVTTVYTPTSPQQRRRDLKRRKDLKKTQITTPRAQYRVVKMGEEITVAEFSKQLSVKAADVIKKLMGLGVMATINQSINFDTAVLIAGEYKYEVKQNTVTAEDILDSSKNDVDPENLIERAPIITVMGHVDHGKTSILDAIKKSDVAAGEAGGITQHIGAYSIKWNDKDLTFIDTPGHEAFSSMRARGAKVTDMVVLVVAADDGVMPQTIEAINHAKAAEVPIVVAVNKIDKPNINVDRIYTELAEHGIQAEDWGGDTQFVKCSALTREGIDDLLEALLLLAEMAELKADFTGMAEGVVIEAHLDKFKGPVASVIVQSGNLKIGDHVVAGKQIGRIRAMHDHRTNSLDTAGPSTAVEILGLSGVPNAGDMINGVPEEKVAREVADWRSDHASRLAAEKSSASSLEDLLEKVKTSEIPEVPFIIKGDTQGSVEAVSEAVLKLKSEKIKNRIVHRAVGGVTGSDITLASASGAVIIAFNVRAARGLDQEAEREGVLIKYFSIIYDVVDVVKSLMVGNLPPVVSEVFQGRAEVKKPISVPKIGVVAGSSVIDGKITRNANCRLIRDDIVIYEGKLDSLRRFKDDVKEVATGYECGIGIDGYNDIKIGDVIEAFVLEEEEATL